MTTLMKASNQWATRPEDERFASLEDLHAACLHHKHIATEHQGLKLSDCSVEVMGEFADVGTELPVLSTPLGSMEFSNWSFGQLCTTVGAPAEYLRRLPAYLATDNLNHGLASLDQESRPRMALVAQNGSRVLRSLTSESYKRIWDADISARLLRLHELHPEWQPAPAAFDGTRGLYASDSDIFAFMVDNDRRIFETLGDGGLGRGFFIWNSEVGAQSFGIMTFLYEYVCGNHRVWGAKNVSEIRIKHVGAAVSDAFEALTVEVKKFMDAGTEQDATRIKAAMRFRFGATKDDVLDAVLGLRSVEIPRRLISDSFDLADEHAEWYGDPRSAWGLAGGMTEIARDLPNASERTKLDRLAGKLMQAAW